MKDSVARSLCALLLMTLAPLAAAQQPQEMPPRVPIDARCDETMKKMCSHLKGLKSFSFEAEILFDEIDDGHTLTLSKKLNCDIIRPNKARGSVAGDDGRRHYWYDGKQLAIHDAEKKVYSTVEVPDTLDGMFDMMAQKYGMAMPISDILYNDPYETLMAGVESARYLGKHRVGSQECIHLSFVQQAVDWQIWIEPGEHPFPRRLSVRYKALAGSPQFVATFTKWDAGAKFEEKHFQFEPPREAEKVDLVPVATEAAEATQDSEPPKNP